jgi:hypothetical protein
MMRNYAQLWLSSIAIAALMASAGAQTWDRDRKRRRRRRRPAGNRTGGALGSGPLTAIAGNRCQTMWHMFAEIRSATLTDFRSHHHLERLTVRHPALAGLTYTGNRRVCTMMRSAVETWTDLPVTIGAGAGTYVPTLP